MLKNFTMSENITHKFPSVLINGTVLLLTFLIFILFPFRLKSDNEFSNIKATQPSFVQNLSQISGTDGNIRHDVLFYTVQNGFKVYFRPNGISYVFSKLFDNSFFDNFSAFTKAEYIEQHDENLDEFYNRMKHTSLTQWRLDLNFVNSNESVKIEKEGESESCDNFYLNHCPNGILNVKSFRKITYKNIYDGIDLAFYFKNGRMKYDFIVSPKGNPAQIVLEYIGSTNLTLNSEGRLEAKTPLGFVSENKPFSFQPEGKTVTCDYVVDNSLISFKVKDYDRTKTLVIDPQVYWSTYFGGSIGDHITQIRIDRVSDFIITGSTLSDDFPVTAGAFQTTRAAFFDAIICKFNSNGTKVWATYYGGRDTDYGSGIATDKDTKVYIAGWTWSNDFPLTTDCYQPNYAGGENDGFVLKLDNLGRREWATYLGGDRNDHLYGIVVDGAGKVAVTGWSSSSTYPRSNDAFQRNKSGYDDAVLTVFDTDGGFLWGTFFGGDSSDAGQSIVVDSFGDLIIGGYTKSHDLPVTGNAYQIANAGLTDAFIAKFDTTGTLLYATYYGGSENDFGTGIATNTKVDMILTGYTNSRDLKVSASALQTKNAGRYDAFLLNMKKDGLPRWATYFGGILDDFGYALSVDKNDNHVLIGRTQSGDLPVSTNAAQKLLGGDNDAFAIRLGPDGKQVIWSTYIGGSGNEWGYAAATDDFLSVYLGGDTESPDFPVSSNAIQPNYANFIDIFLQKVCASIPAPLIKFTGPLSFCEGGTVELDGGSGYTSYHWSNGETTQKIQAAQSGNYYVTVFDETGCSGSSQIVKVDVFPPAAPVISGQREFCENDSTKLDAGLGFVQYLWSTGDRTNNITVKKQGKYKVTVVDKYGCTGDDSVDVVMMPNPKPFIRGPKFVCSGSKDIPYFVIGTPGLIYTWNVTGGTWILGSDETNILVSWDGNGTGTISLTEQNSITGCVGKDSLKIVIGDNLKPKITPVNKPAFSICEGDTLILDAGEGYLKYKWTNSDTSRMIKVTNAGRYILTVSDVSGCSGTDTVNVIVAPFPSPSITGDTLICGIDTISSYTAKAFTGHTYKWTVISGTIITGDGTSAISIKWNNPGLADIHLVQTDTVTGCSSSISLNVRISPEPKLKITSSGKTEFCEGDSVSLDAGTGFLTYLWSTGETSEFITVKTSGLYRVVATDSSGCIARDSINVLVHSKPVKPMLTLSNDTLTSTQADSYKWYENGTEISETGRFIIVKDSSYYFVRAYNQFSCENVSDTFKVSLVSLKPFAQIGLPDTIFANTGDIVYIPVSIIQSKDLKILIPKELSASLNFNKSILFSLEPEAVVDINSVQQKISFKRTFSDTIGLIARLKFMALLGDTDCDSLVLDNVTLTSANASIQLNNGIFCIKNICTQPVKRLYDGTRQLVLQQNVPNPFSDETNIIFCTIEEGQTKLTLFDILGNEVFTYFDKNIPAGDYSVSIGAGTLQTGVYYYILNTPTQKVIKKLEVVK